MPSATKTSLPIDRDSVEQLKEKLLGLTVEDENDEISENGDENYKDEGIQNISNGTSTCQDVALLLDGMGMRKYIKTFQKEKIDLLTFLSLTEGDLVELGITNKKDRNTIIKNLGEQKEPCEEFTVPENHTDDYQIVKNIQNHMLLMQNYCSYVEYQMKKNKLFDYNITPSETVLTFFNAFTKAAIKQSELINEFLYQPDSSSHLIGKLLKANELELPEDLKENLVTENTRESKRSIYLVGLIGLSVVLVFSAKKLLEKIIN